MNGLSFRKGMPRDYSTLAATIASEEAWACFGINYEVALGLFCSMTDEIYVAEVNRQFAGFITLRPDGVGNIGAYVRMVAVDKGWRKKGIGRKMIDYISQLAASRNSNLFLICSIENTGAQKFYERTGFEKVGILHDLIIKGRGEILYRKSFGLLR